MGYTTQFSGHVAVDPPLNGPEMDYLRRFANSCRYRCSAGPYHAVAESDLNRHDGCTAEATNASPEGQPGLWCKWEPTRDGMGIEWNGMEKFYDADEWMQYLIDVFLKPGASLQQQLAIAPLDSDDAAFRHFTFNHTVSGRIEAQGEDIDDRWTLVVQDNTVSKVQMPTLAERMNTDAQLRAAFETLREAGVTVEQFAKATDQDY